MCDACQKIEPIIQFNYSSTHVHKHKKTKMSIKRQWSTESFKTKPDGETKGVETTFQYAWSLIYEQVVGMIPTHAWHEDGKSTENGN